MKALTVPKGVAVRGAMSARFDEILTPEALSFVADLHRRFNPTREALLKRRTQRQGEFDRGALPDFLAETRNIRESEWRVAPVPEDLQDRRVEITGPVDRKMMINALNSGARVFMADFEDSHSPTWSNTIQGHVNLIDAVERRLEHTGPEGRVYKLNPKLAVLLVRPRGWHLVDKHVDVDGQPISASLLDFGLYFFHCAKRLLARGSGPYFYLPKMENHLEARLWNDVFTHSESALGIPHGATKATALIETILAAFEMDEILWELRDHAAGLNAGRWDYIFSIIKKFRNRPDFVLPDRAQVTMTTPFMRAYTELLVQTCHKRGAHAMGGMAAFVPSRKDPKVNEIALTKVHEDKLREAGDGCDGTWVAHPDLVPVATEVFDQALGRKKNQVDRQRLDVRVTARQLLDLRVPGGTVTEAGMRNNISVALQYIESWLRGAGAVALYNLMEDAATAEIARSQVWQWIRHGSKLEGGSAVTAKLALRIQGEEMDRLLASAPAGHRFEDAKAVFEEVAISKNYQEFLTLKAYEWID